MQEAASCLRTSPSRGSHPHRPLHPQAPTTQLPRPPRRASGCGARPRAGRQRAPHSGVRYQKDRRLRRPTRVLAAPSRYLCLEVMPPLSTVTHANVLLWRAGWPATGPRGAGGGGRGRQGLGSRHSWPRVWGDTWPPASPLTKAATWGLGEGLRQHIPACGPGREARHRRPSSTAAPCPRRPTLYSCFKDWGSPRALPGN